jgi:hypothetical protein
MLKDMRESEVIFYEPELIGFGARMKGDTGKYLVFPDGTQTSYIVGTIM